MSLNFEMKEKFLTKLETTDVFFIRTFTYLTALTAIFIGIFSIFSAGPAPVPGVKLTAAQLAARAASIKHSEFSIFLFFFILIFLFFADWFSEKYGFIRWKKMLIFLVLIIVITPYILVNAFPDPISLYFAVPSVFIGLFHIFVVTMNYRHDYIQEYILNSKEVPN